MLFRSQRERRLFVLFLLVFTLFMYWEGANAQSRYLLTKAMVEDGSVEITPYHETTLDKRILGVELSDFVDMDRLQAANRTERTRIVRAGVEQALEHPDARIYSDKAPLSSLLAIPGYVAGDIVVAAFDVSTEGVVEDRGIVDIPVHIPAADGVRQFFIVFTVSVLFGATLLLLLFRDLKPHLGGRMAAYTVFLAGTATFLFPYATTFFGVITAACLGYASFHVLHRYGPVDGRWLYVAGLLGGLAIATEYYAGLIPAALTGLLLLERRTDAVVRYGAGVVIGLIPVFVYNILATGNPVIPVFFRGMEGLQTGVTSTDLCAMYTACFTDAGTASFMLSPLRAANTGLRLLFYPTRGLFFYAPVLLLAVPGVFHLWRHRRRLLALPAVFALFFLFQSAQLNWLAGVSFGPRYMIVGLPFLVIPLGIGLQRVLSRGGRWRHLVLLLAAISIFNMMLGLHGEPPLDMDSRTYEERFSSMKPIQPGFYDHLLDQFDRYGIPSELMMSAVRWKTTSLLTHAHHFRPVTMRIGAFGGSVVVFDLTWIPLTLFALIALLLWPVPLWDKLSRLRIKDRLGSNPRRTAALLLTAILLLVAVTQVGTTEVYWENWYYPDGGDVRWGVTSPSLYVEGGGQETLLAYTLRTLNGTRTVDVLVDGEPRQTIQVGRFPQRYSMILPREPGVHRVTFHADTGCTAFSHGQQCVPVGVKSLERGSPTMEPRLGQEWYPRVADDQRRWMPGNATIHVFNPKDHAVDRTLRIDGISYNTSRTYTVRGNDGVLGTLTLPAGSVTYPGGTNVRFAPARFPVRLQPGRNTIHLTTTDPCHASNRGGRCLSLGLETLDLAPDSLEHGHQHQDLAAPGTGGDGTFSVVNGTAFHVEAEEPFRILLAGRARQPRTTVTVAAGGTTLDRFRPGMIPFSRSTPVFDPPSNVTAANITVTCPASQCRLDVSTLAAPQADLIPRLAVDWYRKHAGEDYRWSRGNATLRIYNPGNASVRRTLSFEGISYATPRTFTLEHDGTAVGTFRLPASHISYPEADTIDFGRVRYTLRLHPGENVVRLSSTDSCTDPPGDGKRCLSLGVSNLSLSDAVIGGRLPHQDLTQRVSRRGTVPVANGTGFHVEGREPFRVLLEGTTAQPHTTLAVTAGGTVVDRFKPGETFSRATPLIDPITNLTAVRINISCLEQTCRAKFSSILAPAASTEPVLGQNWHPNSSATPYRWMQDNATVWLFNPANKTVTRTLRLRATSFGVDRRASFALNGDRLGERRIHAGDAIRTYTPDGWTADDIVMLPVTLRPGENVLRITTVPPCSYPGEAETGRCRSISLASLTSHPSLASTPPAATFDTPVAEEGAPPKEGFIVDGNTTLRVSGRYALGIDGESLSGPGGLLVRDDGIVARSRIDAFPFNLSTPIRDPSGGVDRLTLNMTCDGSCQIRINGISLRPAWKGPDPVRYRLGENWYRKLRHEPERWSAGNATIFLYNPRDRSLDRRLWIAGRSFDVPRTISYWLDGTHLGTRQVTVPHYRAAYSEDGIIRFPAPDEEPPGSPVELQNMHGFNVTLDPGETRLSLRSPSTCIRIGRVNANDDVRCALYGLKGVYLTDDPRPPVRRPLPRTE